MQIDLNLLNKNERKKLSLAQFLEASKFAFDNANVDSEKNQGGKRETQKNSEK